ncbi:MAG: PAS domain S-box protein [Planctomycetota bacterium]
MSRAGLGTERPSSLPFGEALYRTLLDAVPEAILVVDCDTGLFVDGNQNALELFRMSRDQLESLGPGSLSPDVQPDGRNSEAAAHENIERALAGERPVFEWLHRRVDGRHVLCEVRLVRLPVDGQRLVCGTVSDISERRHAEQQLRMTQHAVDTSASPILWVRPSGLIRYVNSAVCASLGHKREALLRMNLMDIALDWPAGTTAEQRRAVRAGAVSMTFESRLARSDGSAFPAQVHTSLFRFGAEELLFCFVIDLSERLDAEEAARKSESQTRRAQRVEAMARLASGVARDFNNLLTVIGGSAELAAARVDETHPARRPLDSILEAVQQAEGVTGGLLSFARQNAGARLPLPFDDVVTRAARAVLRSLPGAFKLTLDVEGAAGAWVLGDPDQLGQVVGDLAMNARDAMPRGGRISIVVSATDDAVLLRVEDQGAAIPDDVGTRIFEPYFASKPRGQATGLRLSTLQGIVRSHGGEVTADSGSGGSAGACFTVRLPRYLRPEGADGTELEAGAPLSGVVLSAEDDLQVAELLCGSLASIGLVVEHTEDGAKALGRFLASPARFDCVILDHDLPGLTGLECARRIRELGHEVPVIIVTGHADVEVDGIRGPIQLLRKPFELARLQQAVRESMGARLG